MSFRRFRRYAGPGVIAFGSAGIALLPASGNWVRLGLALLGVAGFWAVLALVSHFVDRGDDALADRIGVVADQVEQWAADRKRADPGFGFGRGTGPEAIHEGWVRANEDRERHRRESEESWVRLAGRIAPLVDEARRRGYWLEGSEGRALEWNMLPLLAGAAPEVEKLSALRILEARIRRGDKTS